MVSGLEELNTEHVSETAQAGITFWNLIQNKLHKLVKYWPTLLDRIRNFVVKEFREYKLCCKYCMFCLKTGHSGERRWSGDKR